MDKYDVPVLERVHRNYILKILYVLTGLYLIVSISYYHTEIMTWIQYFFIVSLVINVISLIMTYIIPYTYLRKLVKPLLIFYLLIFFPLVSWLVSLGIMGPSLWYVVIPLFIYATFPDTKIIRWLPWYSCMVLSAIGLGLALRYFLYNNVPLTFSSYELIQAVLFTDIVNIIAVLLFTVYSLYYINYLYRLKMNDLESLLDLKNKENTQNSLEINYNEQYKFGKVYEKIVDYIENTQPYLNSKFRIGSISNDLDINILYIERAISLHKNMNFSNFINSYRISHAKKLIHENPQYTLEYIYLSSGFKNQSSFNRIFKALEGITPSEYRKQFLEKSGIPV